MPSDRARYDDEEEVRCRKCGKGLRKPSPVVYDENLGVYHPSCRVPRPIVCDCTTSEDSEGTQTVCGCIAAFWHERQERCFCENHRDALPDLQPIAEMPYDAVQAVLERQKRER